MFFTTQLIITSVAILSVAGFESIPLPQGNILSREPTPASNFRIYDTPVDISYSAGEHGNIGAESRTRIALAYLEDKHGIPVENIRVTASHTNEDTGVSHVYARQTVGGVDFLDGVANINIDKYGKVISSSQTFVPIHQVRKAMRSYHGRLAARANVSMRTALKILSKNINSEMDDEELNRVHISKMELDEPSATKFIMRDIPTEMALDGTAVVQQSMLQRSDGSLIHVWNFALEQADCSWHASINMATGDVESLSDRRRRSGNYGEGHGVRDNGVDFKDAKSSIESALQKRLTYLAIPITKQDPTQGFKLMVNPETASSPIGWVYTNTTSGNNVIAFKGSPSSGVASETSANTFAFNQDGTRSPTTVDNVGAAITNAFYIVNSLHDIFYLYGFTESGFNFQNDNFNKGGLANDRIAVSVQESTKFNYASFETPPDGESGVLRLYLFNLTNPYRDSALQNDIVCHEFALGMVNRLTGGGTATCLRALESKGLGVGWADAVADWISQTAAIEDFTTGRYVVDSPRGVRAYPYSRSATVNPLTYERLRTLPAEEHYYGEVWANVLHNVMAALVDAYGWSNTALTNANGVEGNIVFMHLVVDGFSIQPCNPTFPNARDAIIQADYNRYRGAHACILWQAFASRGLGTRAANRANDFSIPAGC